MNHLPQKPFECVPVQDLGFDPCGINGFSYIHHIYGNIVDIDPIQNSIRTIFQRHPLPPRASLQNSLPIKLKSERLVAISAQLLISVYYRKAAANQF